MTDLDKTAIVADDAALSDFNRLVVAEFRANGGKLGGHLADGDHLLLHTTGAKTGRAHLTPLAYHVIDGRMVIVGAYGGAPRNPAWVHNLRARPVARVEIGAHTYLASVRELSQSDCDAMYPQIGERSADFAHFQAVAGRPIPLFEITPAAHRA